MLFVPQHALPVLMLGVSSVPMRQSWTSRDTRLSRRRRARSGRYSPSSRSAARGERKKGEIRLARATNERGAQVTAVDEVPDDALDVHTPRVGTALDNHVFHALLLVHQERAGGIFFYGVEATQSHVYMISRMEGTQKLWGGASPPKFFLKFTRTK